MHRPRSHPERIFTSSLCRNITLLLEHQLPRPHRPKGRKTAVIPCNHLSAPSLGSTAGRVQLEMRVDARPIGSPRCSLLPALPQAGSCPGPSSHPHTHLTTLMLAFSAPLSAPLCQSAFPHRGPCLPAHSPRTCLPLKPAPSILNSCNCLPSVSSGGLVVY